MKPRVELVYDLDCPNVTSARTQLLQAFVHAGIPASWVEWDRKAPESPEHVTAYGSPTILVDGKDVAGTKPGAKADSCRLYAIGLNGVGGSPPVGQIATALKSGQGAGTSGGGEIRKISGWRGLAASVVGGGAALLPVGVCPACWPAYAGLLSSLGLGFLLETAYLLPVVAGMLGLALLSLAYRAKSRHGYGPFWVGVLAAGIALVGKFALSSNLTLYLGLALLVAASIWNAWRRKAASTGSCPACAPHEPAVESIERT